MQIEFTSTLSMQVIVAGEECNIVRLHAPLFVWSVIPPESVILDEGIEPVFYVDDSPDCDERTAWLLRGGTETACEKAWSIYTDLVRAGVPPANTRHLLPLHLMMHGSVQISSQDLKDFVVRVADHPVKEVGVLVQGFELVLAEEDTEQQPAPHSS